jgi:Ca2+-binding RTX toxin-like protein
LKGVQSALVINSGTIHAEGNTPIRMVGDITAQNMGGADGNDTLAGGGGNDTLAGGLGSDTFGFSALGHYTLTDFNVAQHDTAAFAVTGVTTIGQLAAFLTSVDDAPTGVTYHFGPNASITLIGVSASQVTADMVMFTF